MGIYNLVSLGGLGTMVLLCWALSAARRRVNWRTIGWGMALQLLIAVFLFRVPAGQRLLLAADGAVEAVYACARAGGNFVFGPLAPLPGSKESLPFILATQGLATIIFFAALLNVLYYLGVMQWMVRLFAIVFAWTMRISGAESLSTATNIFVGVESGVAVKPYMDTMTDSELCTILTTSMGTVASSVLGVYVSALSDQFPAIAGHLVAASVIQAPASIAVSKLLLPETGAPRTLGVEVNTSYEKDPNLMVAAINGAETGMKMTLSIVAMLIAFVGLVALANLALGYAGGLAGWKDCSLETVLGYVGYPFAVLMGIPPKDAYEVGRLLGMRAVVTEVPCYFRLAELIRTGVFLRDSRTVIIASYALCGFAHVASLAIFVGGYSALAPSRTTTLTRVGPRALLGATITCFMTAAVAGLFYGAPAVLPGR